ncbi:MULTISPECIES: putative monovalent cation/H+ antiporter subunit A [unclassified Lentimonas]|uniref:putative monovalent cation/H+ antiporter subunit A n=1 Tax=unclassified Lentimonas TaxID=2630993 RepID=UPI00132484CD|nr:MULTISPECIES: putative monovalent cation/H+ antiporter subunit A [unclassified Lentimonas]CAA6678340.1 Na(+) H(+) antiporter subunit A [Lentimonas sp. CC4]CAA6685432.1 Na(+) H(+) antiporter subunit A [Lentimonas sp. CC6]CAA7076880.1 Na(+) H(+) antiporter subunit A [Lentimonas sp. CC4]CAA7170722.1 Na(+) H(+) antiporter subunit A [Lentimonas sp. CC21]CAA7179716.1 Na(+) H(+) antiporter subunit A [Lentimonas sp. CC8]
MSGILLFSLLLVFGASFAAPLLFRLLKDRCSWLLAVAPFGAFVLLASQEGAIASGSVLVYNVEWFSSLGAAFSLRLDGLSLLMALLVTGVGGFIVLYAGAYMHGHPRLGRFYLYLLSFMGAMLGLVLSDNLILLFVFWELTSITSYLLIGFNHEQKIARWKALQALLVTGLGAMSMLAGFILLGVVTGSLSFSEINGMGDILHASPWYTAIVILVLGGAFTKSAQVPFHFWLPNAMAGPTPVSAYLHSATMVKAGIFLMARLNPALSGSGLWEYTLAIFGSVTLLLAVCLGLFQKDAKAILAYTTLGVLGVLTLLLGIGSQYAIKAMVVFLLGHALYKATLFMVVGSVDHETGTRDVTILRGLRKLMPITAIAGVLAALSMSGLPPFFGFIGKELIYKAGVKLDGFEMFFLGAALVGNLLMMGLALKAGVGPFFGKSNVAALPKKPHEAPFAMWVGPIVLSVAGLVIGIFPFLVTEALVSPAIASIQGTEIVHLKLELWHLVQPNLPLLLSGVTVLGGVLVFLCRTKFWAVSDRVLAAIRPWGADAMYGRIFNGTMWLAKSQTSWLQTGRLHDYVFMIVAVTVGFLSWAILNYGGLQFDVDWSEFNVIVTGLVLVMVAASIIAVTATTYVTVLVALGVVGFGVAMIFVYYGAPDLAITQLLVETLTVVLFMYVILRLPPLRIISRRMVRIRDAVLASTFGFLIMLLVLKAVNIQFNHAISEKLAAMSYPEAKGKNVVNVILVDFRAMDTLGEIVVVSAAALGIAALVSVRAKGRKGRIS